MGACGNRVFAMATCLFDTKGDRWSPSDPGLKAHLLSPRPEAQLTKYAVENLGWIHLSRARTSIRIACRPAFVTDEALAALLMAIYDIEPTTIALNVLDKRWEHLIVPDRRTLVRVLSALIAGRRKPPWWTGERLIATEKRDAVSDFAGAVEMALITSRSASRPNEVREAFDAIFHGRWHLCRVDWETGHSIAVAIGASFTPFNPGWNIRGEGLSLCSYADDAYGLWVAQHHRHAVSRDSPIVDHVDAVVSFPRIGDTRLRYRRMTLPLKLGAHCNFVLSAAVTDSRVDLRNCS